MMNRRTFIWNLILATSAQPLIAQASFLNPPVPLEFLEYGDGTIKKVNNDLLLLNPVSLLSDTQAVQNAYAFFSGKLPRLGEYNDKLYDYTDDKGKKQSAEKCKPNYREINRRLKQLLNYDKFAPVVRSEVDSHFSIMAALASIGIKGKEATFISQYDQGTRAQALHLSHIAALEAALWKIKALVDASIKNEIAAKKAIVGATGIVDSKQLAKRGVELISKDGGVIRYKDGGFSTIDANGKRTNYSGVIEFNVLGTPSADLDAKVPVKSDPNRDPQG